MASANLERIYRTLAEATASPSTGAPRSLKSEVVLALSDVPNFLVQLRRQDVETMEKLNKTLAKMKIYGHLATSILQRTDILIQRGLSEPDDSCEEFIFKGVPANIARRLNKADLTCVASDRSYPTNDVLDRIDTSLLETRTAMLEKIATIRINRKVLSFHIDRMTAYDERQVPTLTIRRTLEALERAFPQVIATRLCDSW